MARVICSVWEKRALHFRARIIRLIEIGINRCVWGNIVKGFTGLRVARSERHILAFAHLLLAKNRVRRTQGRGIEASRQQCNPLSGDNYDRSRV
jgi:hypothetical protein